MKKMRNLLVVGAGGHGHVVAETAQAVGSWEKIAFVDDRCAMLAGKLHWPVLSDVRSALSLQDDYADLVVAVGDAETRLALMQQFDRGGFHMISLTHPSAWVSPTVQMGKGVVITAQAAVNGFSTLGDGVIVNTGATVDHHCQLEQGVHVCPGSHLAGEVVVKRGAWIGIGASVVQGALIGAGATVGAGAAVIGDVEDGKTVVGVPAHVMER